MVILTAAMYGFLTFNLIVISYEESMRRLPPNCLTAVSVVLTMGAQFVSSIGSGLYGILLSEKTKERALIYASVVTGGYLFLSFFTFVLGMGSTNKDKITKLSIEADKILINEK